MIFPVVLGARLFGQTSDKKSLRLISRSTVGSGLVFVTYEFVRNT